jgi:hypothetical protein
VNAKEDSLDRRRGRVSEFEGEPRHRAEAAIDRINVAARDTTRSRPKALTAREALTALQFEIVFVHVYVSMVLNGEVPSDSDRARFLDAAGRINVIADEALR